MPMPRPHPLSGNSPEQLAQRRAASRKGGETTKGMWQRIRADRQELLRAMIAEHSERLQGCSKREIARYLANVWNPEYGHLRRFRAETIRKYL